MLRVLEVFENTVLKIFGLRKDELRGGGDWRKQHSDDLRDF
jgi:hypothetical protein